MHQNGTEVDCAVCKTDLWLSAVVSRTAPGEAACPEHAAELPGASADKVMWQRLILRFYREALWWFFVRNCVSSDSVPSCAARYEVWHDHMTSHQVLWTLPRCRSGSRHGLTALNYKVGWRQQIHDYLFVRNRNLDHSLSLIHPLVTLA